MKKLLLTVAIIIVLSNIPPIYGFFRIAFDSKHYRYSNANGSFTSFEFMGRRFDTIKSMHLSCIKNNSGTKQKTLYRLFSKNPAAFWRWRLYILDERYKLPYMDWKEIEKIRKTEKNIRIAECSVSF